MDLLDRMLEHDLWATTVLLDVTDNLSESQLDQPFDIGHRTLRATLAHFIDNVPFWTALMAKEPAPEDPVAFTLTALRERHQRSYSAFAAHARQFRDEQRLNDIFVDHYDVRKTMAGTIIQVVQHNAEHRTELIHIFERLGVPEIPEVDHGVWDYYQENEDAS